MKVKFVTKKVYNSTTEYKLFDKISIYKKEKFISAKAYYIFGLMFLKKRTKPYRETTYLFGIKIKDKKIDLIPKIRPYGNGKDFIYYCFHTGEFYYLAQIIKVNMDKFKDTVIITNFKELKSVLSLFDFDEDWINDHFVAVRGLWYFSYALHCKSDGSIISEMELDHEKGWRVNGKLQKAKGKYLPINNVIQNFLGVDTTTVPQITENKPPQNTVLLLPESQFNGNLGKKELSHLIERLTASGFKVAINTKSANYDDLLNDSVCKIFLSYKETFDFASTCKAIIGVRSGLYDCLQDLAFHGVECFVIYQNKRYPHYKFFKNFHSWFTTVYNFNDINTCQNYKEYFAVDDFTKIEKEIINQLLNKENTNAQLFN